MLHVGAKWGLNRQRIELVGEMREKHSKNCVTFRYLFGVANVFNWKIYIYAFFSSLMYVFDKFTTLGSPIIKLNNKYLDNAFVTTPRLCLLSRIVSPNRLMVSLIIWARKEYCQLLILTSFKLLVAARSTPKKEKEILETLHDLHVLIRSGTRPMNSSLWSSHLNSHKRWLN